MVIDPNSIGHATTAGAKNKPPAGEKAQSDSKDAKPSSSPRLGDNVSLSPEAKSIGKLESALAEAPDVDSDKVNAVRSTLASGQYQINADTIAAKLIDQDSLT